jgi:HicB family
VSGREKLRISFPLRLAASLKDRAKFLATRDGVSLNHFINLAVAEKVSRLEAATEREEAPSAKRRPTGFSQSRREMVLTQ